MKKLALFFLIPATIVSAALFWFYKNSLPPSSVEEYGYFIIERGSSASEIGRKLEKEGFIKNPLAFKIYLQFTGRAAMIQAGEFRLTPSHSLFQTITSLLKGPVEFWVTIPEGLRREEIAQKYKSALNKDDVFVESFLRASEGKEGYLFPETYLFPREASASAIIKKMTDTFEIKTGNLKNNSGYTLREVLIIASLIEREAKTNEERPMVAGILINRLKGGWPLQIDASVQYAVGSFGNWWPILNLNNLSIESAYNTYKNTGLPPGPISNPGISSIKAALDPEKNDYWYYIHDKSGNIHYAKTLEEHNSNVAKYLR